jgi:hypothetical protein
MEQEWTGINPSTAVPERTTAKFAIDFEAHIRKVAGSFFIYCFFYQDSGAAQCALGSVSATASS